MCVVSTVQKITFQQDGESSEDPIGHQRNSMINSKVRGLQLGDFLRYGRFLTIAVLVAAYLGHQASESKSFSKLDLSWLVRKEPTTTTQSWWVVAYALIAYTMFGSGRWLIHRSFKRITTATSSVFQQVASQEALTKIRSSVSMRSIQLFGACQHDDEHCGKRTLTLSVEKPFVSEAHVATMTLGDIKDVFQFAFQCDTVNFDSEAFASELREPARQAIEMLDLAVRLSRGERVGSRVCENSSEFGSLDVLTFIGACRIFAEWRPIRLVPEGYGRYSFGMNIGRRDMVGNITKVEKAVHAYLDEKVQQANGETVSSPSIRDILEYELAANKHTRRPTLANNTAAQGILWLKRQLQYQTAIFTNTSEIPYQFPDSKAAARAAYEHVYGPYHGFFVRGIFQSSFDAAPPASVILRHMNLPRLHETRADTNLRDDDDDDMWIQLPVDQESYRSLGVTPTPAPAHPFLNFVGNVVKEHIVKLGSCIGMEGHAHPSLNVLSSPLGSVASLGALALATAAAPNTEYSSGPDKDVAAYLFVLRPFLHGLDNLMKELNMNDPSRV